MKILVGYIRSPEGRAALDAAISETRLRDGELVVVHSVREGTMSEARQTYDYAEETEHLEKRLAQESIRYEVREPMRGKSPADDLVEFAGREEVGLIVIGIRRRSPVGKLVLGSNAQEILLAADCPVLAVKAA
jgi:nucleotide-binding universal stress UspA family protein